MQFGAAAAGGELGWRRESAVLRWPAPVGFYLDHLKAELSQRQAEYDAASAHVDELWRQHWAAAAVFTDAIDRERRVRDARLGGMFDVGADGSVAFVLPAEGHRHYRAVKEVWDRCVAAAGPPPSRARMEEVSVSLLASRQAVVWPGNALEAARNATHVAAEQAESARDEQWGCVRAICCA